MKNIKPYLIIGCLALLATLSCNKRLDETIFHNVAEESYHYNNAYEAIGIVYTPLRALWDHHAYYMANETSSDEIVMPANASGWDDGGIYKQMHLHSWTTESPQMSRMWNDFYTGVLEANNIIGQLEADKIPIPSESSKESLIAEVRVARALYYWLIMDNFGDAALVTTTATDSLPSKTDRAAIYDFVVKEITESLPALSEDNTPLMYGRFNKWGAKTLLANVYLNAEVYTGQAAWAECLAQCNDVIASGKYHLDPSYKAIFVPDNEHSPEIIFAIPLDENQGTGFYPEMFSWHAALKAKREMLETPWGSGSAMGVPQFVDTYDPDDQRLEDTWMMGPQFALDGVTPLLGSYDRAGKQLNFTNSLPDGLYTGESEGYRMNKFEVQIGSKMNLSNDFPFFRYAGVLLMKAECLLRTNKAAEAAQLVSNVRQRAFSAHPAKAKVTASDLTGNTKYQYGYVENYKTVDPGNQDPVQYGGMLDELGWEFAWEAHRRRDDIRFGVFTTKSWLSHKPKGADRSTFMIPQAAINANPKLK